MTLQDTIRTVMLSSRDSQIIQLWLEKQPSPYTAFTVTAHQLYFGLVELTGNIWLAEPVK